MRSLPLLILLSLLSLPLLSACSDEKSEEISLDDPEDLPPELAAQAEAEARESLKGLDDDYAAMIAHLQGKTPGSRSAVTPVSLATLQTYLPPFPPLTQDKLGGESSAVPFANTRAEVVYLGDEGRFYVELTDSAYNAALTAPISALLRGGAIDRGSPTGYRRATTLLGQPAFERFDSSLYFGELTLILDDRFLLTIKGAGLKDPTPMRALAEHLLTHFNTLGAPSAPAPPKQPSTSPTSP